MSAIQGMSAIRNVRYWEVSLYIQFPFSGEAEPLKILTVEIEKTNICPVYFMTFQSAFTFSKSTMETEQPLVKSVQN